MNNNLVRKANGVNMAARNGIGIIHDIPDKPLGILPGSGARTAAGSLERLLCPAAKRRSPGAAVEASLMATRSVLRHSLLAALAILVAAPTPIRADDKAGKHGTPLWLAPVAPTLVFLTSQLPDPGAQRDAVRRFKAAALQDLKESGAFRLLDPAAAGSGRGGDPGSLSFWRSAGANLAVRFATRSLARGRLLIESECINLETGAVLLQKSFIGEAAAATRIAHRLVDFVVGKVTGTRGVADSTIVCARPAGPGIQEIFGMDRDGRNPRQLTNFGSLTGHPALAPDGRLACVTYKGGPPQIWGQVQPGGPFQRLYPQAGAPGLKISDLAWSPDGGRLAFVQEDRRGLAAIYILDPRTGRADPMTSSGRIRRDPSWNPAGTELAYVSDQDGSPQVYVMAGDGGRARRLTGDPAPKDRVAWSAQGDRIAYVARQEGRFDLVSVTPAGSGSQKIASSAEPVDALCWAPDGRWLLFGLAARDGSRLRVAGPDGRVQDLGDGAVGGTQPQWTQNPRAMAALTTPSPNPFQNPGPAGRTLVQ
jgi:TolB protein